MTEQQVVLDDILDERRKTIEQHLDRFERLGNRLDDVAVDLKDLDLPIDILRDLEMIEMCMTRVAYFLRDQLWIAPLD